MDQLTEYIQKARQSGYHDRQIQQALYRAGWTPQQIEAAFKHVPTLTSAAATAVPDPVSSQPAKRPSRLKLTWSPKAITAVIIGLIIIIGLVLLINNLSGSYESAGQSFISAVQTSNQSKADSLEDSALKTSLKQTTGLTSFEKYCISRSTACMSFFTNSYLNRATKINVKYLAMNHAKGESLIYKEMVPVAATKTCPPSTGSKTLELDLIPQNGTWLVDNIYLSTNINTANSNCAQSKSLL